jgi:AcrR family transcriptional regulator
MPRVRDFGRTRTILVATAGKLFASQGYDRTSVDSIIRQAGVSKGAFYHHFSSKEQVLEAVTDQLDVEAVNAIEQAIADTSVSALVRFNRFFDTSRSWSLAHFGLLRETISVLFRDENARMRRMIEVRAAALIEPLLAGIIRQGVDEGVFDSPAPAETARMILRMAWVLREAQVQTLSELGPVDEAFDVAQRRLDHYVAMVERMLGAPNGSIQRLSIEPSRALLSAAQSEEAGVT